MGFQDIKRELVQHVQGGVAASEVIHLDNESQFTQMADCGDDLVRILRIGTLCDLQMKA